MCIINYKYKCTNYILSSRYLFKYVNFLVFFLIITNFISKMIIKLTLNFKNLERYINKIIVTFPL